ncbi:UDP-3-O-(3-hydroxymyristoyl)glucosamine N-acyltr ansferase [Desulfonema ishimotonii]|uniref:UDP-3-O-acylglucosamine N-acyltransferase n=1 Tax=Desulfonema ishimotonii TaxID=45657 RepID=A0A401FSW4_9BACT|nr:UDP-3-O-(3-hydroxymyristoyl)glucosamine N-acyltransferase [Desulfonema ishimotonii]GBC60059.1 UDP-3-O-(3-hydroxymyristoyl)glucosamine N-acyltr ansferase [Desulfonema ishimotonii]
MKIRLTEIAETIGGEIIGDAGREISGVAPFEHAGADHITLAGSPKFLKALESARAGAVIVPRNITAGAATVIAVDNPGVAFAKVVEMFHPKPAPEDRISPRAHMGEAVTCGQQVSVGHFVSVGDRVSLGNRVRIHPGVVIGADVTIGDDVEIYPNVTIRERCRIGSRVIIHAGTVIGSDGFGFAPDGAQYYKIPHTGIVQIDDDTEIGACNAIDRGTFGKTHIGRGVKTDNLVHIAHNVTVGENSVLVAQVGISGSTRIGKHAILAGQAGISGHLNLGDNVTVGPQAGIAKSVPDGEIVSGSPGISHRLWLRVQQLIPKLPEMRKRVAELEKRLEKLEEK